MKIYKNLQIVIIFSILINLTFLYILFSPSNNSETHFYEFNVTNRTLGFGHIYAINLANRQDRRHRMEAIASSHNLDFEFFTAISKDDYETLNQYKSDLDPSHKACYVSHYILWELIAHNRYMSALILEDDVDFEMDIVSIMSKVYRVLPADWEMLYIGHCSSEGSIFFKIRQWFDNSLFQLLKSDTPACAHAYAISYSGALKLLKEIVDIKEPVDVEIVYKVRSGDIISYSIEPSAIVQWKSLDNPSDVSPGTMGSQWPLKNSTLRFLGLI
ncbi:glycosyltransferase family 25 protein [Gigaspora rosea]|uniref:Glycosyltransferase family 25 protein n=1 Tax=Gigaspora rosea TaxID=44941 RepID=A0A397VWF8_9GLOM|nr:glycosyltransferase family 25 protein [Gigaspora rosea]